VHKQKNLKIKELHITIINIIMNIAIMYIIISLLFSLICLCCESECNGYYNSLTSNSLSVLTIYQRIYSENCKWYLTVQDDGNVVGYEEENHIPFFATNTSCYDPNFKYRFACMRHVYFYMQSDGNLVLYFRDDFPVWNTNTSTKGIGPYKVTLQNDRNIVLTDSNNEVLWNSETII
jgi:hypothetical protein